MLNANDILSVNDTQVKELEIPEWGGTVYIKTMTGAERDRFEMDCAQLASGNYPKLFRARFACTILCDENGKRLFKDGDAEKLANKAGSALDKILEEGMAFNAVSDEDVKELEKN